MTDYDHKKYVRNEKLIKLLFLWPALAILLFLIAYPFIMLIYYSFFNFSFLRPINTKFIGLTNYLLILTDTYTWERFIFTFKYVGLSVSIQFILGILIAWLLQRNFRGKDAVFTVVLMPMMLCPIVVGLLWRFMFNTEWGIINYFLHNLLGFARIEWLGMEQNSLWATIIANTWMWTPFMVLLARQSQRLVQVYEYHPAAVGTDPRPGPPFPTHG